MTPCEGKVGGICGREATWKQAVHAGQRATGRVLLHSFWCDEHAETIRRKRQADWQVPPDMAQLVADAP